MPTVEYLQSDRVHWGRVSKRDAKGLQVQTPQGRTARISRDKVLFEHPSEDIEEARLARDRLVEEIDVALLWETLREERPDAALEATELSAIYFDTRDAPHASAVFHALVTDRQRFRRRGMTFTTRSPGDIEQMQAQEAAQRARADEAAAIREALDARRPDAPLRDRLERWLRGQEDRGLQRVLEGLYRDPAPRVFEILLETEHFPATADLEPIQANLRDEHPGPVLSHAAELAPAPPPAAVAPATVSIDDEDTREVDDVLTVSAQPEGLRVDVDIADASAWIQAGDPVDREAQRRASTAYLPTGPIYMLPERIGCDLASLHPDAPRPAFRFTAWFSDGARLDRWELSRTTIQLGRRLSYEEADALLSRPEDPVGRELRRAEALARQLAEARREAGAFSFSRPEWKVYVSEDGADIRIKPVPLDSPSRFLVSEMMILANRLAAEHASQNGVPLIYRTQERPKGDLPDMSGDRPPSFEQFRGLIQPASLSLKPGWHWGLGLPGYTQVSSPLRRYADLIGQRQLAASLSGAPPPHDSRELLRILANAESTERELKRVEAAVRQRWTLEWLERQPADAPHEAVITGEAPAGHFVILQDCGARGVLVDDRPHALDTGLPVRVQRVRPRAGNLRLRPAD